MPIVSKRSKFLVHWVGFKEGSELNYSRIFTTRYSDPTEEEVDLWRSKLTIEKPDLVPIFIIGFYRLHD